jgi:hypothetical protein
VLPVPRSYSRFKVITYNSTVRYEEIQNTCKMLAILSETTHALPVPRSYSRFKLMTYFSARDEEIQNTRKMLAVLAETNWFLRFQSVGAKVDLYL